MKSSGISIPIAEKLHATCVNLLPPRQREARRQRLRARLWFGVCVTCAVVLVVTYGAWSAVWSGDTHDLTGEIAKVGVEINDNSAAIAAIRGDLISDRIALDVDEAIAGQPDWSLLLALLSKTRGDEVVLDKASLEFPAEAAQTAGRPREPMLADAQRINVRMSGYGRTQMEVSSFILRLEETALFDTVALLKNSREPFLTGEAVAFRIECTIRSREGESR